MRTHSLLALLLVLLALASGCQSVTPAPQTPAYGDSEQRYRQAARLRGQALAAIDAADWLSAIVALDELESVLPGNLLAPLDLAICHQQLGHTGSARQAIARAAAIAPANPSVLYTQAVIQRQAEEPTRWPVTLARYSNRHPRDPRPHYLAARWLLADGDSAAALLSTQRAIDIAPENIVLLVEHLVAAAASGLAEETTDALDALEDRLDGFEQVAAGYADTLRVMLAAGDAAALSPPAQVLRNILRPSGLYRQHLIPLRGASDAGNGFFVQLDFEPPLPKSIQGGQDIDFSFVDRSQDLREQEFSSPIVDLQGELFLTAIAERDAILVANASGVVELARRSGGWRTRTVFPLATGERLWGHFDFDQDGAPDWLIESERSLQIRFDGSNTVEISSLPSAATGIDPVDLDHDGDLDLIVTVAGATHYLQNNGDGSWLEDDSLLGELAAHELSAVASADFDGDGDLDLVAAAAGRVWLLSNPRSGALNNVSTAWQLDAIDATDAQIEVEDFDADGRFDLLLWNATGGQLLLNRGDRFTPLSLPAGSEGGWRSLEVADFDNDGDRDLLVVQGDGVAVLLRNQRTEFVAEPVALVATGVEQLLAGDYDGDGDLDLLSRTATTVGYWRNDGGSLNHWLRIRLRGKTENNSKNNSQGLFVRIEGRTAGSYQAVTGNGGVNHLGLGAYRQVDALRVVWTNGLAQSWAALAADQTLDEQQVLKGSCPFLYTWNGERFEFITDLMWTSPLGMIFADGSNAPHQSARDFVLIPGDRLRESGGELWLQVTEELWETVYVDRQKLYAIDHPADVELVVDEQFTMPPHPEAPPIHWLARQLPPVAAYDHNGHDVLAQILTTDGDHVDELPLTRYQGVTSGQQLILDFADVPAGKRLRLVLRGWIFPTDTSINFALAQNRLPPPSLPRLDLATAGGWRTLLPVSGFPNGKRKAVVIELTDLLPAGDVTLRLATEMQIYWDSATLAVGEPQPETRITVLEPGDSDLHYRGFSRLYRQSATGPHLFDYAEVSTEPRFRDLAGRYTRFGPVGELLYASDDRYVVMNAGDELTIRYPTAPLPPLPAGWRRDYVLYTDGWVKDGDIHTAQSQTVEPLPFHAMESYPDPHQRFPDTVEHRRWQLEYQTRRVDDRPFRRWQATVQAPSRR